MGKLFQVTAHSYVFLCLSSDGMNLLLRLGKNSIKKDIIKEEELSLIVDYTLYQRDEEWELAVLSEAKLSIFKL